MRVKPRPTDSFELLHFEHANKTIYIMACVVLHMTKVQWQNIRLRITQREEFCVLNETPMNKAYQITMFHPDGISTRTNYFSCVSKDSEQSRKKQS